MPQTISKSFKYSLVDNLEHVIASEVFKDIDGSHPMGIDIRQMSMVSVIFDNKGEDPVLFSIKPGPEEVDPDTGLRIFVEPEYTEDYCEVYVLNGAQRVIGLNEYYPYIIVTGIADDTGDNPGVVYVTGYRYFS